MAGDVYYSGERIARADFDRGAKQLAADMIERGLKPDDCIAISMRNDPVYLQLIIAARYVGVRFAMINWHSAPLEVQHILEDSGAKLLYAHSDLLSSMTGHVPDQTASISVPVPGPVAKAYNTQDVPVDWATPVEQIFANAAPYEGDPKKLRGMFAYTSGSTGRPKGIKRITAADGPDMWDRYIGLSQVLMGAEPGDRIHISAPLYHSAPNALSTISLSTNYVDIFLEPKFDSEVFLESIHTAKITHAYVVPTMMIRMLKLGPQIREKYDVSSLKWALTTGSPFPMDIKRPMID